MAPINDFFVIFTSWLFWVALGLSLLGLAFVIYLLYKGKDKIAYWIISIPLTICATIVLGFLVLPLIISEATPLIQQIGLTAVVSAIGYPTLLWFCKNVVIKIAAKMFGFNITKGG